MAMNDEERIIEALAKSRYEGCEDGERSWAATTDQARAIYRKFAAKHLAALRKLGCDVTLGPALEPTYTIRLTEPERQFYMLVLRKYGCGEFAWFNETAMGQHDRLAYATPDPEPGA